MSPVGALRMWSGTGSAGLLADVVGDLVPRGVDGVGLGRERQIARGLRQRELALGRAEEVVGLLGVEREAERVRIGVAHVLGGEAHEAARDVERILAGLEHPPEPVERAVGIGVAQRLVQGGDEVVVLLARLVVEERLLLGRLADRRLRDAGLAVAARRRSSRMLSALRASPLASRAMRPERVGIGASAPVPPSPRSSSASARARMRTTSSSPRGSST